ncbi:hypothetical protein, partial [Glutamicibacter sp. AOP3-A1-12]|uniref:hypothetical protein n=1 Tax=Glutamicibacter sp. AOP3-A1-12 TaxID=3457701 RepID=UPI0040339283
LAASISLLQFSESEIHMASSTPESYANRLRHLCQSGLTLTHFAGKPYGEEMKLFRDTMRM